jgi:hypothetical protein
MGGSVFSKPMSSALGGAVSANPTLWEFSKQRLAGSDPQALFIPLPDPYPAISQRERGHRYAGGVMPGQVLSLTIHGSVDPTCLRATNGRP